MLVIFGGPLPAIASSCMFLKLKKKSVNKIWNWKHIIHEQYIFLEKWEKTAGILPGGNLRRRWDARARQWLSGEWLTWMVVRAWKRNRCASSRGDSSARLLIVSWSLVFITTIILKIYMFFAVREISNSFFYRVRIFFIILICVCFGGGGILIPHIEEWKNHIFKGWKIKFKVKCTAMCLRYVLGNIAYYY